MFFIFFFILSVSCEYVFDCSHVDNNTFHPILDCQSYWHCISNQAFHYTCPSGTKFDIQTNNCQKSEHVTCPIRINKSKRSIIRKPSRYNRRYLLHILTSNDEKIREFSLKNTHGLVIHCNEIRRHRLKKFIFSSPSTTTQTNSSLTPFDSHLFSLTIILSSFLFLQI